MQLKSIGQRAMFQTFRSSICCPGFTIFELMIAMAIASTLLCIAMWGIVSWIPDLRLSGAARSLKSDMHAARMTAIQLNAHVVSEFDTLRNIYFIYIDNGAGDPLKAHNYRLDEGETTIRAVRLHPHLNMVGAQFGKVAGRFAFNSRGAVDGLSGGIYLTNLKKSYRGVTISRIGKITVKASNDGRNWQRMN